MAQAGRPVFGPSRAAARLETSKAFAKEFMARHGVPTARYRVCQSADEALACVRGGELGESVVVKADGLAAGKGVVVAPDRAAASRQCARPCSTGRSATPARASSSERLSGRKSRSSSLPTARPTSRC